MDPQVTAAIEGLSKTQVAQVKAMLAESYGPEVSQSASQQQYMLQGLEELAAAVRKLP